MIYAIAVLGPLAGFLLAGSFGRALGDRFAFTTTIAFMLLASVCAEANLLDVLYADPQPDPVVLGTWFDIGGFHLDWALRRDTLSSVMVAMVAPVATLIHIYSVGYMAHEEALVPLLRLSLAVQLCHADAGHREQPGPVVLRLGGRGPRELPADRLLVRSPERQPCCDEGVHREPRRRPVLPPSASRWCSACSAPWSSRRSSPQCSSTIRRSTTCWVSPGAPTR